MLIYFESRWNVAAFSLLGGKSIESQISSFAKCALQRMCDCYPGVTWRIDGPTVGEDPFEEIPFLFARLSPTDLEEVKREYPEWKSEEE